MTEAQQQEIAVKICELKHRLEGSSNVQSLMLSQYSQLCMMGSYEQAQNLRSQLPDYLDVFLDSCVENSKLMRQMQGLQ
jgi:hypothetical protein